MCASGRHWAILYLRPYPPRFHDISCVSSCALMATTFSRLVSKAADHYNMPPAIRLLFKVVPNRLPLLLV